jgi:hypothetical protein
LQRRIGDCDRKASSYRIRPLLIDESGFTIWHSPCGAKWINDKDNTLLFSILQTNIAMILHEVRLLEEYILARLNGMKR